MIPRILIVGGPNVRLLAAAIVASLRQSSVVVVEEESPAVDGVQDLTIDCSNYVTNCNFPDLKLVCDAAQYEEMFESGALDGIRELREWFQNKVTQVRNGFVQSRRQHRLPIFQPCWSSRRWRSVT